MIQLFSKGWNYLGRVEGSFMRLLSFMWLKTSPYIPFTTLSAVRHSLEKGAQSLLDVGCGEGKSISVLPGIRGMYVVGVDAYEPYLEECRHKRGIYQDLVLCNASNLPFQDNSFDIVLAIEVLEHLSREDGELMLLEMERVAKKQVIITTPLGKANQPLDLTYDPLQIHQHIWTPSDLRSLGYQVKGIGLRLVSGGGGGIYLRLPRGLQVLSLLFEAPLWLLGGVLAIFTLRFAGKMICTKRF